MSPWGAADAEDHGEQSLVTGCLHCEWVYEGTLDEGKEEFAAHAKEEHGIEAKPQIKRRRRSSWTSRKALEDNIAGARAQGAARWTDDDGE